MSKPFLSIVYPAYNEGLKIEEALTLTVDFVDARNLTAEILVVDDGSRDDTKHKATQFAVHEPRVRVLSHTPNHGKGYAVKRGMLEAAGEFRVFLDVDMATPLAAIDRALPLLEDGSELVIGSRHLPESEIHIHQSLVRETMGKVFRWLALRLLPLDVSDITCGFKGMPDRVAQMLFSVQREQGWAFDAEMLFIARKWGLRLDEIPVTWTDSGDTRVRALSAAYESFVELLRIRRHDRRGAYAGPQPGADA